MAKKISYQISAHQKWKIAFPHYKKTIDKCLDALDSSLRAQAKQSRSRLLRRQNEDLAPRNDMELSILLTTDAEIKKLNRTFRGKNKPTNVLSFPQGDDLLGDVVMAIETLKREAKEQDKTFHDHFSHLFIHGVLHLLGYDHEHDDEQNKMEKQEKKILHKLGIADPYI